MTPIELMRILFNIPNTISDYEAVALVFQEVVVHREQAKQYQPILIDRNSGVVLNEGPKPNGPFGWEVK
jgi:hypothetical protein